MESYITPKHQEACVAAIKQIVSYPSVCHEGENGTPFGQAIQDVLEATLDLCQGLGFHTYIDPEGYYGYAELGDQKRSWLFFAIWTLFQKEIVSYGRQIL